MSSIGNYLAPLSREALESRGKQIAALLAKTEAELAKGIRGRVVGSHIVKGSWVNTYANESARNWQTRSLEECRREWKRRFGKNATAKAA
jgi:hypothetical protein